MPLDLKGIHQYEETDAEPTFSELLNLGMQSVSDSLASFAGTAAERAALTPAPDGATWRDKDGAKHLWYESGGTWQRQVSSQPFLVTVAGGWTNTPGRDIQLKFDGEWASLEGRAANGSFVGYWGAPFAAAIPAVLRPSTEKFFPLGTDGNYSRACLVGADGVVKVGASAASATPYSFDPVRWRVA